MDSISFTRWVFCHTVAIKGYCDSRGFPPLPTLLTTNRHPTFLISQTNPFATPAMGAYERHLPLGVVCGPGKIRTCVCWAINGEVLPAVFLYTTGPHRDAEINTRRTRWPLPSPTSVRRVSPDSPGILRRRFSDVCRICYSRPSFLGGPSAARRLRDVCIPTEGCEHYQRHDRHYHDQDPPLYVVHIRGRAEPPLRYGCGCSGSALKNS